MLINGVRFCDHCVRKVGGSAKAWSQPGIFNDRTRVRHLNRTKRDLSTLCGLKTNNSNWTLPWREYERQERERWRRREKREAARSGEAM